MRGVVGEGKKMFSMCARRFASLPVGRVQFHLHVSLLPWQIADKSEKVNDSERCDAFCWAQLNCHYSPTCAVYIQKNEVAIVVREGDYFAVSTGRRSILTLPSFIHSSFTSFCRSA